MTRKPEKEEDPRRTDEREGDLQLSPRPTLAVGNSPIKFGSSLNFSFSGFRPNIPVYVYSDGKGVNTTKSDESGSGYGYFVGNDSLGSHVLEANDGLGHKATASFIIQ